MRAPTVVGGSAWVFWEAVHGRVAKRPAARSSNSRGETAGHNRSAHNSELERNKYEWPRKPHR